MNNKILYFTFATVLSQVFAFGALFMYTSILQPNVYAVVAIFEVILFFLQASIGLAIDRAAQRFYVDYDGNYVISIASSVAILLTMMSLLLIIIFNTFFHFSDDFNIHIFEFLGIYIAAVGYILHSIILVKYQFENKPKLYFLSSIAKTLSFFLLSLIFLNFYKPSASAFIYSSGLSGIFLTLMAILITKPILLRKVNLPLCYEMLRYAAPFVPTLLASWVLLWSNRLFMVGVVDANDIGVFSAAQRVGMIFFVFVQAVTLVATPTLFEKLKAGQTLHSNRLINVYFSLFFFIGTLIVFYLPLVLSFIFDSSYQDLGFYIAIIMFANFISAAMAVSTNIIFNFYKKTVLQMTVFLCCAVVALVLNFALIPLFALHAVLFNLIFVVSILFCLHLYYCKVSTNFRLTYLRLLVFVFAFGLVCLVDSTFTFIVVNEFIEASIKMVFCLLIGFYTIRSFIRIEQC